MQQQQQHDADHDDYEEELSPSGSYDDEEDVTDDDDDDEEEEEEEEEEGVSQEKLLCFTTFPLDGLRGQHIMVVVAFHRFVLVGTNRGVVALVESTGTIFRMLNLHADPISDLSCDTSGEYLGSSDKAGVVTVQNLYDDGDCYRKEFDVPVQSLALHPKYTRIEDRPIVVGVGDKVVLITRTMFLGRRKMVVLQERCGKVHLVHWRCPNIIAWANDRGVQLYSYSAKALLHFVPQPNDSLELGLYRCSLVWEAPHTLTCAWRDWVQVLHVHELRMEERLRWGSGFISRTHRVDVMPAIRTHKKRDPYHMCGIAPFGADRYLVLACDVGREGYMNDLEVRIVERATFADVYRARMHTKYKHPLHFSLAFLSGGTELLTNATVSSSSSSSSCTLTTKEGAKSLPIPYSFSSPDGLSESVYFIVSMDNVIKATPTDSDDHVEYLLNGGRVTEAYEYARGHTLRRFDMRDLGHRLLEFFFDKMMYDELMSHLPGVLGCDYAEWERWILLFDRNGVADLLVDVLPDRVDSSQEVSRVDDAEGGGNGGGRTPATRISEEYYALVLLRCMEKDVSRFGAAIQRLKNTFSRSVMCHAVEVRYNQWKLLDSSTGITDEQMRSLGETYGLLLQLNGQYDEALHVLLQVNQSDELFNLIRERRLFAKALEILPELFARSKEKTVEFLLEQLHTSTDADDEAHTALSSLSSSSSSTTTTTTAAAAAAALMAPEAVVRRLERTRRQYLWVYLKALQTRNKAVYAELLKAQAQLVAALFIENEPSGLLAFLRENFGYLQRLNEIYALCKKHQMLEEMVFLLSRMGKEEEGLRIIVQEMKNMKKAVQYVADIPNRDDQLDLYCKLIHMAIQLNDTLRSHRGQKCFEHLVVEGETWSSIAKKYNLDEDELRMANGGGRMSTSCNSGSQTAAPSSGGSCIVPLNPMQSLLQAVVDPSISGRATLDPTLVIEQLPENEPMPHVGDCIAAVARSKANDVALMKAVVRVATSDVRNYYETLYRRRAAALRVEPKISMCCFCHQPTSASVIVFGCSHTYHASCVVGCISGGNAPRIQSSDVDLAQAFRHREDFLQREVRRTSPYCRLCYQIGGSVK